jgi:myo-inositol 2-dehydrogenase/D-chiro-inositol 1-dehydrogenase
METAMKDNPEMQNQRQGYHVQNPPLTRREFVKATAAVAGSFVAGRSLSAPIAPQSPETLKVGLIGCGGRGCGAAIQALDADAHAVLYAAADVFADRLEQGLNGIRSELQRRGANQAAGEAVTSDSRPSILDRVQADASRCFAGFEGYQRVIDLCDVVILATPSHFRPMHLRAAVQAKGGGRHVFCEKPVAVDAPGVRSVLESARIAAERNLSLVSGFCWRYSARERETFKRIHNGAVGDIRAVYTTYNAGGWVGHKPRKPEWSDMEYQLRNWHYFTWLSGDHVVEQACHSIDKIAWAFNGRLPLRCTAVGGRQVRDAIGEPGNAFDHFSATFEFDDGSRAFHMCRHFPNTPFDNSDLILGTKGTCTVNGWADVQEISGENPWKCQTPKNNMYQQEHDELFGAIRSGRPINDGQWMAHSTMMAIMARMAAYSGQTITWEQAMNSTEELKPAAYELGAAPEAVVARPGLTKFS